MNLSSLYPQQLVGYFKFFYRHVGNRLFLLLALMFIMSWSEGLGIALFYPILGQGTMPSGRSGEMVAWLFRLLHLDMSVRGALVGIVIMFVSKGAFMFFSSAYAYRIAARLTRRLRQQLVDGIGHSDYRYLVRAETGFHTNLLVNEVRRATDGFVYYSRSFPPGLNIVVFFALVLVLDWHLTFVCAAIGGITVLFQRVGGRIARRYSTLITDDNAGLTALLIQAIQGFKYLRATRGFNQLQRRIEGSADRLAEADYRVGAITALMFSLTQPLMVIFFAVLVYSRSSTPGGMSSLFVILIYFLRIMTDLFQLQLNWQLFCGQVGAIDVVASTIGELQAHVEESGEKPFAGLRESLACRELTFGYSPDKPILRDVTLSVPRNASVALVGESGAGKTTLADVLIGTLKPSQGAVYVDGGNLQELKLDELRAHVGYVPQECIIFNGTVAENISLWAAGPPDDERVRDAARRARCAEFIEAMPNGYASAVGDRGINLSGGQRQRLAIARELYKRPDILVLDEATSALDTESERAIQASIEALKGQITIVIIAHRLSTVRSCDCIYVLEQGRIVESGTYEELFAQTGSRFRRMCELQDLSAHRAVSQGVT
jgi:ABC-type multidrug transport system fused ATPase/permease subunit